MISGDSPENTRWAKDLRVTADGDDVVAMAACLSNTTGDADDQVQCGDHRPLRNG